MPDDETRRLYGELNALVGEHSDDALDEMGALTSSIGRALRDQLGYDFLSNLCGWITACLDDHGEGYRAIPFAMAVMAGQEHQRRAGVSYEAHELYRTQERLAEAYDAGDMQTVAELVYESITGRAVPS